MNIAIKSRSYLFLCFGMFNLQIALASSELDLSDEKTKITSSESGNDCKNSAVIPWSFDGDKPIESPCKLIRTAPPIEWGPKLLGLGKIEKGIRLPTGAVWQPAFYLLGSMRSALSAQDNPDSDKISELAIRADVFFNLQLSATERVMIGFTPLNEGNGFSRYQFSPDLGDGWTNNLNAKIDTFWLEGDLGELFPRAKNAQRKSLDMGFSLGRQVIAFQDSIMMNDALDALVLVKNNIHITPHSPSTRLSMVYAWNDINRSDGIEDDSSRFFGIFSETDTWNHTIEFDLAYMTSNIEADGGFYGFSSTQRSGFWNSTYRLNGSFTSDIETTNMRNGSLLSAQFNRILKASHNIFYLNMFAGFDEYRPATRDEDVGGVVGLIGISFASPGLGNYGSALSNQIDSSYGMATGIQWFFNHQRNNLIVEIAAKHQSNVTDTDQQALSLRFQKALAQRWIWQVDAYIANQNNDRTNGIRTELKVLF